MELSMHQGFTAIGLTARVRNDDPSSIVGLWERFSQSDVLSMLPEGTDETVHCIYHGYSGTHLDLYKMTIGYVVVDTAMCPAGLEVVRVPPQNVMKFEAIGDQPGALVACWQSIWQTEMNRAFLADFDIYDRDRPDHVTVMVGIDVGLTPGKDRMK